MKKLRGLRRGLTMGTFLLTGTLLTGTMIANENATVINNTLHEQTWKIVNDDNTKPEDNIHFKSVHDTVGDVTKSNKKTAEDVVSEGTVLLKNENNALPLAKDAKVTMVGEGSYFPIYGGTGSGGISKDRAIDYATSLKNAGFSVNPTVEEDYRSDDWKDYRAGKTGSFGNTAFLVNDVPWETLKTAAGDSFKTYGDAAVMVISRQGGEGYDLKPAKTKDGYRQTSDGIDKNDGLGTDYLGLTQREKDILSGLKELKKNGDIKKIIVVVNYSSMIEGDFLSDPDIDAALWAGAPGSGNAAFGKILNGEVNPSGRLADTMWVDNAKNPINVNFRYDIYPNAADLGVSVTVGDKLYPEVTLASYQVYQEGMYLGYRYTETRYEDYVEGRANVGDYRYQDVVARPFGYGLSYSTFETSDISVTKNADGRHYDVSLKVTNTGDKAGKFSVPVYVSKPYGTYAQENEIQVPSVELIDYAKTDILEAGKSETLSLQLDERYFASYDAYKAKTYVLMDGDYYVAVGGDAHQAVNNVIRAKGHYDASKMVGFDKDNTGDASKVTKFTLAFDQDKYSTSDYASSIDNEKHKITNLFSEGDINLYSGRGDNHVDYYSRDNWNNVSFDMENGHPVLKMTEQMAKEVYAQVPDETGVYGGNVHNVPDKYKQPIPKDDGEYPTYGKKNNISLLSMLDENGQPLSYFDKKWDDLLDELSWEDTVKLVSNGVHVTEQVNSISKPGTRDENGPSGFSASFFGGAGRGGTYSYVRENSLMYFYAKRIGALKSDGKIDTSKLTEEDKQASATGFASAGVIAATFNKDLARRVGEAIGEDGLWLGYSGLYGIGLNIHRSPYLGRTSEYFSEDGMLTGLQGANETKGIESKGVHVYNKHCFLNEFESCRHGISVWGREQAFREIYLRGFELSITLGGGYNVMSSFSRCGTISGAANGNLNDGFLRNECGMKGVVVTDYYGDMNGNQNIDPYHEQVYGCYYGGATIPDGSQPQSGGHFNKYRTGYSKMAWKMREAAKRLCYYTLTSNAINGMSRTSKIVDSTPSWQATLYTFDIILTVLFVGCVAWDIVWVILLRKKN